MANQLPLVDDSRLKRALGGVQIEGRLFDKLILYDVRADGTLKPEGEVRVSWIVRLVQEYGFESKQIDIEVAAGRIGRAADLPSADTVYADIVVFRDTERTEPFVVIETKPPDERGGVFQAESYARNLGAEYHVWHDGKNPPKYFRTSRYPRKSEGIGDIPRWVGTKPVVTEISKTVVLPPFRDETQMREVVHQCHELILEKQGHDPAKAFDELTKLLFLKLYDEREIPSVYKFMVLANEDPRSVGAKLRSLFREAVMASRYRDVFSSKYNRSVDVVLELDDFTIFQVVQLLQGYSLVNTSESIHGADIKGTVFEQMVGNTFRGELAQFFTPRELVEFIVDMISPDKNCKVFDPACGSGGFLIMAIRSVKDRLVREHPNLDATEIHSQVRFFAEHNLFGSDINDRMARVAKMNMIMHGDGHSGIVNTNGLLTERTVPDWWLRELRTNSVDIIYSNPPFAGREKDPDVLLRFELGKNKRGKARSVSKEVLFIELIIKLLKPGGRAGLVLPAGVFNNPSMKVVRDYIRKNAKIVALVGLPHLAFQVTGANNEGHLLFLEKVEDVPPDYDIFIDWAAEVGIDSVGRKTDRNHLVDALARFRDPPPENIIRFSQLTERIDPWYYHPNYRRMIEKLQASGHPWYPLKEIFTPSQVRFKKKEYGDAIVKYIEKNDVDVESGRILSFSEHVARTIPSRATYLLKAADILFPNAYDSMRGLTVVPPEYEGFVATNRFFVLRHNPDSILLEYLEYLFRRPEILALIKRECSGEINPGIAWTAFSEIEVPVPPIPEQERILGEIDKVKEKKLDLLQQLAQLDREIEEYVRQVVPTAIKNYDDVKIVRAEYIGSVKLEDV